MIINRLFVFILFSWPLIDGLCHFNTDSQNKALNEKLTSWNIPNLTVSANGFTYSVGICQSVDNAEGGMIQRKDNLTVVLGKLQHVIAIEHDNWILLTYREGDRYIGRCDNNSRTGSLMLVCGQNKNNLNVLQDDTNNDLDCNFMFQLQVPQLCPPPTPVVHKKLSGGAIFLIILFSLITVYLVTGVTFMHFVRGARGLEHIPNLNLWRRLGNLAADGCDFCCRCERPISRAGYFLQESEVDMNTGDDDILSP